MNIRQASDIVLRSIREPHLFSPDYPVSTHVQELVKAERLLAIHYLHLSERLTRAEYLRVLEKDMAS